VKEPRFDRRPRVRLLSVDKEARLRTVLTDRDQQQTAARLSGNANLDRRGRPALPDLPHFSDHLTPAILLSMNTALRMGETRRLRWDWIDLERRWLTVDGAHAKTRQTRHVPLNDEAHRVLIQWREQAGPGKQVFQVATCFKTSLRYAHLAPDQRREVVARLDEKPLYSVALRLPGRDTRSQVMPLERPFLVNGLTHNSKSSVLDLRL